MVLRVLRIGFGLLTLVALAVNLENGISEAPGFRVANFFSYFTVQSNVLAAIALIGTALVDRRSSRWEAFRGLATFAMVVTGLVYNVLLADIPVGVTDPWINDVIHRVMPVVMLADWVLDPPQRRHRPPDRAVVAGLSARLRGLHADPRPARGRLLPVPVHQPGRARATGRWRSTASASPSRSRSSRSPSPGWATCAGAELRVP